MLLYPRPKYIDINVPNTHTHTYAHTFATVDERIHVHRRVYTSARSHGE